MTTWFSPRWRLAAAMYVGCISLLACYWQVSGADATYFGLILLTLPTGYLMPAALYVTSALADLALGTGPDGSPAVTFVIAVVGFSVGAALNVLMVRIAVLGVSASWGRCRHREPVP